MMIDIKFLIRNSKCAINIRKSKDIKSHEKDIKKLTIEIHRLKQFFQKNGILLYMYSTPRIEQLRNLSQSQINRLRTWEFNFNNINDSDAAKLKTVFGEKIDTDYIVQLYDGVKVFDSGSIRRLADFSSTYVNIINGNRVTLNTPCVWERSVYCYGSCTMRGTGVEDGQTIPSFMQQLINSNNQTNNCRVVNKAIGCGYFLYDDIQHIKETALRKGDIVIILEPFTYWEEMAIKNAGIIIHNTSQLFNKKINAEWFTDSPLHTTCVGNEIIARYIYESTKINLEKNDILRESSNELLLINYSDSHDIPSELQGYIDYLETYVRGGENNGAIVMNCNPFTLGHKYLIEYAASQVKYLYIFVVQEDKSYFSFDDRLKLVMEGVRDIQNVIVIPSGKFIISADTFPGYFMKENDPNIIVDTSSDVRIFGKYIAPKLGIRIRFAGEEPIDNVTRQYNQTMKSILPEYGVEFMEIQRKKIGDNYISASFVRELIEKGELNKLHDYVPQSTYTYLEKRIYDE